MLLYDIPLIKSSLSIKCLGGLFTRTKSHDPTEVKSQQWLPKTYYQVIVAKSSSFELYRFKRSYKHEKVDLQYVNSTDVYGEICNIETFTVKISESKDYLDIVIISLNTGELLIFHYSRQEKKFVCSFRDIIFKQKYQTVNNQNPRNVGNYIVCSEQNHFMICSVRCFKKLYQVQATQYEEKIKINIKAQDAHVKENHICWSMIWLPSMSNQGEYFGKYVAIEKAVVTLQMEIGNKESMLDEKEEPKHSNILKKLRYYYVERNYKLVQRQQKREGSRNLNDTAHMLIPLSSSSFFILYENRLRLRQLINESSKDQPKQQIIDVEFPLRQALVDKNIKCIFSAYSRQFLQDKKNVIHLVNEYGDLFKIEYYLTSTFVASLSLKYVNSVKTVHSVVYVGEIVGNQIGLGENQPFRFKHETATLLLLGLERFSVSLYLLIPTQNIQSRPKQTRVNIRPTGKSKTTKNYPECSDKISFKPIAQRCRDLQICDQIQHMGVIIDAKVANLRGLTEKEQGKAHEENFEIFALTNSGNLRHEEHIDQTIDNVQSHKSYLKIIKKGLKIKQVNSLQSFKLHQIFCFKKSEKQLNHKIVILCTSGKTNSFTIANDVFTNNKELSFEENVTSVYIGKLEDESYIQVMGNKIRHIRREKNSAKQMPIKNKIVLAICSGRQIFVVLYGGQVILYELDKEKDSIELRKQFYVNDEVVSIELTPLENNKIDQNTNKRASRFLIIGTKNYEIIIYKLIFKSDKQTSYEQVFAENIKSPIQTISSIIVTNNDQSNLNGQKMYHIFLGLENGSMVKIEFDRTMKKVAQKISTIGSKPVKLKRCSIGSRRQDSLLITTDKTFVYYNHNSKYKMHLIACSNIDIATEMKQAENPNTIMTFGQRTYPHKDVVRILSIQSFGQDFHDERVDLFFSGKKLLVFENNIGIIEADPSYEKMKKRRPQTDIDVESSIIEIENLEKTWKSQFTIYKVKDSKKIAAIYFDQTKQICICAAYNSIKTGSNAGNYLIFGCAEGISYYPRMQAKQQTIKIYSWLVEKKNSQKQNEYKTQFLYSLNIDAIPLVIESFFKGQKFLIGIGNTLRMYEIGKKKLLLKAEVKNLPSNVNQIKTIGKKIYITSVADSFHLFKYIPQEKTFYDVAQDQLPKFITAMNIVDAETVCAADKFGNLFVGRLTENAKTQFESLSGSSKILQAGHLCKFNILAKINVGQIVTSIQKVSLYTSKTDVILYSTVMGQIRVLYPLTQYEQVKVLPILEQKIKQKYKIKEIGGNNWGASKNLILGEYVEKFLGMSESDQREVLRNTELIDEDYLDYVKDMIEGIRNKII